MRWSLPITAALVVATVVMLANSGIPLDDPWWWYTNDTPPAVAVQGPTGAQRSTVAGSVDLPLNRARIVSFTVDGQPHSTTESGFAIDSSRLTDGQHLVQVVVRDRSRRQNQSITDWTFVSDNSGPRLDVTLDPQRSMEGRTLLIRVRTDEPTPELQATLDDRDLSWQGNGPNAFWMVTGVSPEPAFESQTLRLRALDALGNETNLEQQLDVQRRTFPFETLDIDPQSIASEERAAENARLQAVYARENGPPRWDGPFRVPVEGPRTTEFGTRRSYEHHPGTDFGAALGAPVMAPANGIVAVATETPARGNVIVLDHGAGVYSTYAHLQRFDVQVGSEVRRGDVIGRVGSTGFSTGPHLHWELWVDGANVDPMEWTTRRFP